MNQDQLFMKEALLEAQKAFLLDEVPIGAVIVQDGIVIARGHNLRETGKNAAAHAELLAINEACSSLGGWRLPRCTLYVTLEPCPMCAGAMINARIDRVVFGAYDPKAGSCGSLVNLFDLPYNHRPLCEGGVLETECAGILSEFFRQLRQKRKT
ncbi:tRNA adenosine(34) deaminase TadA [Massiliimalia massiliensis]|uniref:tRNA adenosine(34) deaminase TadA n=1 Tax=Massiliimalia massiliensis TaxID=1852384 RepID=UPI000986FF90|nr:tRNA adenosine(34) deaminase TadA [Massiliimalia massiliensis]